MTESEDRFSNTFARNNYIQNQIEAQNGTLAPKTSETEDKIDKKGVNKNLDNGGGEELYHPVRCQECETEIAVYDKDEVYHFFNVLESIS